MWNWQLQNTKKILHNIKRLENFGTNGFVKKKDLQPSYSIKFDKSAGKCEVLRPDKEKVWRKKILVHLNEK